MFEFSIKTSEQLRWFDDLSQLSIWAFLLYVDDAVN